MYPISLSLFMIVCTILSFIIWCPMILWQIKYKHIVSNILYFGFSPQYSDYVRYVEPCFKGILVQADLDNREVNNTSLKSRCTHTHSQLTQLPDLFPWLPLGQGFRSDQRSKRLSESTLSRSQSHFPTTMIKYAW